MRADLDRLGLRGARLTYLRCVLALMRPLRAPLARFGVDYGQFAMILKLRLALSLRGSNATRSVTGAVGLWITALGLLGLGVLIGLLISVVPSVFWAQSALQAAVLYFGTLGMLIESSTLFGDRAEDALVLPTPVDGRTLLLARGVYAGVTVVTLVGCLIAAPLVFGAVRLGPLEWVPATVVASAGTALIGALAVVLSYLIALRWFGPDRFKSVIAWAQLSLLGTVYLLMYVLPPLLKGSLSEPALELRSAWMLCAPPLWYGGLQEVLGGGAAQPVSWWLAGAGLFAPLALLSLGFGLARGRFLEAMGAASVGAVRAGPARASLPERLARRFARPGPERAGFILFASLAPREPGFRMRVVPTYLILCAMGAGSVLRDGVDPMWTTFAFYALLMGLPLVLVQARFSEDPRAAWMFAGETRALIGGVRRAAWVVAILAPCVLMLPVVAGLAGVAALPHAAFALSWTLAAGLAFLRVPAKEAPFSQRFERQVALEALGGYFGAVVVAVGLGFAQAGAAQLEHGLWLGTVLGLSTTLGLWHLRPQSS